MNGRSRPVAISSLSGPLQEPWALRCGSTTKEREARHERRFADAESEPPSGEVAVKSYRVTLRDRETQIVVGYYDGSWTTDRRRAVRLHKLDMAEAHAARLRERCPRNADLIKVEELEAAD